MNSTKLNLGADVIDSRDIIARIEELESEECRDEEQNGELTLLLKIQDVAEVYSNGDWQHSTTLIRDSYFTDYCEELVKDIGDLPKDMPAYIVIDWEATADNLKVDYTEIDVDGTTYYIR